MSAPSGPVVLHATAVACGMSGLLIVGASGSGKSALALQLIGLGATLIADDRVVATPTDGCLRLAAPEATRGLIEARGVGLLRVPSSSAWARAVVDLDAEEGERMPRPHETVIAGVPLRLLRKVESAAFPSMLQLFLLGGTTHDS